MEVNFEGDILYFIELNQEENETVQVQHIANVSNECDNWLENETNLLVDDDPPIYLNVEPSIGEETEIFETPATLEISQQIEHIPKTRKIKSSPNILKFSRNKRNKSNVNNDTTFSRNIMSKNDILISKTPKVLEMTFINDIAYITFKDEQDQQMFLKQQLKVYEIIIDE